MVNLNRITVKPPATYGPLKQALFKLGAKAYREPTSLARDAYDSAAAVIGLPLSVVNPLYDYGGIRRDIKLAYDRARGEKPDLGTNGLSDLTAVSRTFRVEEWEVNKNSELLNLAVGQYDRQLSNRSLLKVCLLVAMISSAMTAVDALHEYNQHGLSGKVISLGVFAIAIIDLIVALSERSRQLEEVFRHFIVKTDPKLLINKLPLYFVHPSTKSGLENSFAQLGEEYGEVRRAVRQMPTSD
ncbi:MAG: hypothetical protein WC500_00070 [Candidatus Margulisiibacteriota bacterium]